MALKDWVDGGKCLLGFHQGPWTQPPGSCVKSQTCERCGVVSSQTEHDWKEWAYATSGDCIQERACHRCDEREQRTEHAWSPWEYEEQRRAPVRGCLRCGLRMSYFVEQPLTDDVPRKADTSTEAAPSAVDPRESSSTLEDNRASALSAVAALRADFDERVATGEISADRQPLLRSILNQLEDIEKVGDDGSLEAKQIAMARTQQLMMQMGSVLANPSRGAHAQRDAAPGSRHAYLVGQFEQFYRFLTGQIGRLPLNSDQGRAAATLLGSLNEARNGLLAADPAADPVGLEFETLRQVANDIRGFSLRHHLTMAQPIWPSHRVPQNPNAVFYSGGPALEALLVRGCESRRLTLLRGHSQHEAGSARWQQLCEASVAVFDFTGFTAEPSPESASAVAAIAYELGIALALGRPVIVAAREDQSLPFDLDIEPVRLPDSGSAHEALAAGLDRVLYSLQRGEAGSSVLESIREVRRRHASHKSLQVRVSLERLDDDVSDDPVRASLLLSSVLMFLGSEAPVSIHSTWPGGYPDSNSPFCFHVMPFGPSWASQTMQAVKQACHDAGVVYARGDLRPEPDILRSIWADLCRATHVVVDLTGMNANVVLELGIAHTLGRNVCLVSQDPDVSRLFPSIAKQRVYRYNPSDGGDALRAQLQPFLSAR